MMRKDEIRVLRDAYKLHLVNTDYSVTETWEKPIVSRMEDEGILEISVIGRILDTKSYRLAPHAVEAARQCYELFESEREELTASVLEGIANIIESVRNRAP